MNRIFCVWLCCFVASIAASAADRPMVFDNDQTQARYDKLLEELRCLVCQNQSLADSHADLAQDLRDEVYAMVISGKNDAQIADFMVARYGDFVLYKPPMKASTWTLWFGPLVLLLVAVAVVVFNTRKTANKAADLSDDERARLNRILDADG